MRTHTIPEKNEKWTPFGRIILAVLAIAAVALFVIMGRQQNPADTPEKSEPDICAGLSEVRCMEERSYEAARQQHYEQLRDAGALPRQE